MQNINNATIIEQWEALPNEKKLSISDIKALLSTANLTALIELDAEVKQRMRDSIEHVNMYRILLSTLWIEQNVRNRQYIHNLQCQLNDKDEIAVEAENPSSKRIKRDDDQTRCRICFNAKCCIVFGSCGHICCCAKCSVRDNCPICQEAIANPVFAYLPY